MIKTTNEINELLKEKLENVLDMEYNLETEKYIADVFTELTDDLKPQTIELQDIKFIKPALKLEYLIDNKHYTMIIDVKRN